MKRIILVSLLFLTVFAFGTGSVAASDYDGFIEGYKFKLEDFEGDNVGADYVLFETDYHVKGTLFKYTIDYDGFSKAKWLSNGTTGFIVPNEITVTQIFRTHGIGSISVSNSGVGGSTTTSTYTISTSVSDYTYKYLYYDITISRLNIYWHTLTAEAIFEYDPATFVNNCVNDEVIW